MDIKDNAVRFYIQNFIINKSQNIEVPGFIFFKVSGKTPIFARQVIIPEDFFINLERSISQKGKIAQNALYSAGKKFGYHFSLLGSFYNIKDKKGQDLINYINIINKFIEGTYASRIECKINPDQKTCNYNIENFIVLNKLGYGYFLPLGAAAGLMSYFLQDPNIEGVLENFNEQSGSGTLLYAPAEYLKNNKKEFFSEINLSNLEPTENYISFNQVHPIKYSNYSFKSLLNSKYFSFNKGIILNNKERYFILEVTALYLIEKELNNYSDIIYNSAFNAGLKMLENVQSPTLKTITDYLSAFGWGDILIIKKDSKYVINVNYFPYTNLYNQINYLIFSGIVAGMLSIITQEHVKFKKVERNITQGYLSVSLFS